MTLTSHPSEDGSAITISIDGNFDYTLYKGFRDAYQKGLSEGVTKFILNLSKTKYMDSSALGMLLVLKDRSDYGNITVTIKNCNKEIKNILAISNFEKLFSIE